MLEQIAKDIAESVKKSVQAGIKSALADLEPRLKALEALPVFSYDSVNMKIKDALAVFPAQIAADIATAFENLPQPKDGKDGADGKSIDADEIKAMIDSAVAIAVDGLPKAKDGADGKSIESSEVKTMIDSAVAQAVAALPPAKDGIDGESVSVDEIKSMVQSAVEVTVAALPKPENGKDIDPAEIKALVDTAVAESVAAIPLPKDGKDADMEALKAMIDSAVAALPPAKDGESVSRASVEKMLADMIAEIELPQPVNGKDAVDIDILSTIDEEKSYPRGAYASHRGGLWKSFKKTHGMNGWECIVDGHFKTVVNQVSERIFCLINEKSSGVITKLEFEIPCMSYKGIFKDGDNYSKGDTVTWGGSLWTCLEKTNDKPGVSKTWQLSAKKGRDGKVKV